MRTIYVVPNIVTTANMFCGFYSMTAAIRGDYVNASWSIILAAVFDLLDGRIARLAKATSAFGVQYDSLSDLVSFGIAPAMLFYQWILHDFDRAGLLAAFLYVTCAALRLARFNVNTEKVAKNFFQGIPSPAAAGTVATFVIFRHATSFPADPVPWVIGITFVAATLMVSSLRFPSFKGLNWRSRASFPALMSGVMTLIVIAIKPEVTLFLGLVVYIVVCLGYNVLLFYRERGHAAVDHPRHP
jgi:CDP-diacylglycerol---serine O-phosphatidyltransferase